MITKVRSLGIAAALALFVCAGCNTVRGFGGDVENLGEGMQEEAYEQQYD